MDDVVKTFSVRPSFEEDEAMVSIPASQCGAVAESAAKNALERPSRERSPAAALEQLETTAQLLQLLDTLSAEQQEVVRLKFQHGLSYRQIGEVTGRTSNHVGVMLHTALKTLRERAQRDTTGSASTQGTQS